MHINLKLTTAKHMLNFLFNHVKEKTVIFNSMALNSSTYNTRKYSQFSHKMVSREQFKKAMYYWGPIFWNNLQLDINSLPNMNAFIKHVDDNISSFVNLF